MDKFIVDEDNFNVKYKKIIAYKKQEEGEECEKEINLNNFESIDDEPYDYTYEIILTNKNFEIIFWQEDYRYESSYFGLKFNGKIFNGSGDLTYLSKVNDKYYKFSISYEEDCNDYANFDFTFYIPVKSEIIKNLRKIYNFKNNIYNKSGVEKDYFDEDFNKKKLK